jgi:homocysteine S-methyltransferase
MTRFDRLMDREGSVAVLDGGLATELEARGCDLDDPLWSAKALIEQPEAIVAVHSDYLAAGADIITTATYQATFEGLARRGLDRDAARTLMTRAVELAERARNAERRDDAAIAVSIGSYGAFLADGSEYTGDYGLSVEELVAFHEPRLALLAPLGDVVACETIPCLDEAKALAICLRRVEAPAWVSFSCRDGASLCHGEPLRDAVRAVADVARVRAVGINCTPPRFARDLVAAACEVCDTPAIAYPNSGEHYDGAWGGDALSPEGFAELAETWVEAGARIVGGCCRTTPEHIRRIAERVRR